MSQYQTQFKPENDDELGKILNPKKPQPETLEPDGQDSHHRDGAMENFSLKPHQLVAYLDQYIVRQEQAKIILATKICTHFNRIKHFHSQSGQESALEAGFIKNNILLIGPTGVGKTYLIKLIADRLGVPFVKADATKFSETGYVGGDVEDLVRELVQEAEGDLDKAQYGIIYLDEVDKIAATPGLLGPDVSRSGVQRALLKPMEDTTVNLKPPHDPLSQIQAIEQYRRTGKVENKNISTRHILFIMSGAFAALPPIIRRRMNHNALGFAAAARGPANDEDYFRHISAQDLTDFGFETEFIGRLPVLAVLESLSQDDLREILSNPNNPVILSKRRDFAAYGIELVFTGPALHLLAGQAAAMATGARALVSVLEQALTPFEHALPAHPHIRQLAVSETLVQNPQKTLAELLDAPEEQPLSAALQDTRRNLLDCLTKLQEKGLLSLERVYWEAVIAEYFASVLALNQAVDKIDRRLQNIDSFEREFNAGQNFTVAFDCQARQIILAQGDDIQSFLAQLSQMLTPGLSLANSRLGINNFTLPVLAIEDPEKYLRQIFAEYYQEKL